MVPSPVPLLAEPKRIHFAFVVAVHGQSGELKLRGMVAPAKPNAETEKLLAGKVREQVRPAWVTVRNSPAIQSVAERSAELGLRATEYASCPIPLPAPLPLSVIQFARVTARQGQLDGLACMLTLALPQIGRASCRE